MIGTEAYLDHIPYLGTSWVSLVDWLNAKERQIKQGSANERKKGLYIAFSWSVKIVKHHNSEGTILSWNRISSSVLVVEEQSWSETQLKMLG